VGIIVDRPTLSRLSINTVLSFVKRSFVKIIFIIIK